MTQIIFKDRQEFNQAALNRVAELVSQNGQGCLDAFVPNLSAQRCLQHLSLVCFEMSYDPSLIDAFVDVYKKTNDELSEFDDESGFLQ
ncbi:hypothetical protein NRA64_09070 [Acinetobacter baumannii]|nr:hypothetical protein [Acinetobacter baumannii]